MDNAEAQLVTIVIPVYKKYPDNLELFSVNRCCEILGNYPISVVTYEELDMDVYLAIFEKKKINFKVIHFDKKYFSDTNGYNNLMVNPGFYKSFGHYKYILIYQLDSFVFSDHLTEWCKKEHDYIGAPWINVKWNNIKQINKMLPFFARYPWLFTLIKGKDGLVGNGGFSLRKIDSHIKFSKIHGPAFETLNFNEDVFWGKYVAAKEVSFKIPLIKEAISFAIETEPEKAMNCLNNRLPFGCHAWVKVKKNFWIQIFHKNGIEIPEEYTENKNPSR